MPHYNRKLNLGWLSISLAFLFVPMFGCSNGSPELGKKYHLEDEAPTERADRLSEEQPEAPAWQELVGQPDSYEKLFQFVSKLQIRRNHVPAAQQLADRMTMLDVANELEKMELDNKRQFQVFQLKTSTLIELAGAGNEQSANELQAVIDRHLGDERVPFARSANILQLSIKLNNYFTNGAEDFSIARAGFTELAKSRMGDGNVVQAMSAMLSQLVTQGKRDEAVGVMEDLAALYGNSDNEAIQKLQTVFNDRVRLIRSGLDTAATKLNQGELDGQEQFVTTLNELASHSGGLEFYRETVKGVRVLEQKGLHDEAKQVYANLTQTYADNESEMVLAEVKRDSERGLKRLALVGKPMVLKGTTLAGEPFDPTLVTSEVTVVFFWSAKFPRSAQLMTGLLPLYNAYYKNGLGVVTVCIDPNPERARSMFQDKSPPWPAVFSDFDGNLQASLDEMGIQMVPYAVLIDKDHKVLQIHVSAMELTATIRDLLGIEDVEPGIYGTEKSKGRLVE